MTGTGWVLRLVWPDAGAAEVGEPRTEVVELSPGVTPLGQVAARGR